MSRIVIVGGGFTGASATLQLLRRSQRQVGITVIEPRPEIGFGLAYSSDDPDHRLNAPATDHFVDPLEPDEFQRWCSTENLTGVDPDALAPNGSIYARRFEFGRFISNALVSAVRLSQNGSSLQHVVDVATDAVVERTSIGVKTKSTGCLAADMVLVTTGNAQPRLPPPFARELFNHQCFIGVPTDLQRLRDVACSARVLIIGSGLTALDVLSTLLRQGHQAPVVVISRRGLRPRSPRPQPTFSPALPDASFLQRIENPVAPFICSLGPMPSARALLRGLRARIREEERAGRDWYGPFDELRDGVWQVWPSLPQAEKRRFLRQLRPWYDAHRFRCPPQNDAIVRHAEQRGIVSFRAARIQSAELSPDGSAVRVELRDRGSDVCSRREFDVIINCTGLDVASGSADNPFLTSLLRRGLISKDASTIGFAVDTQCRAIDSDGKVLDGLRILGPPTAGTFGDPLGSPFIAAQIHRVLPSILSAVPERW